MTLLRRWTSQQRHVPSRNHGANQIIATILGPPHDVVATLNQRQWRWFNVAAASYARWVVVWIYSLALGVALVVKHPAIYSVTHGVPLILKAPVVTDVPLRLLSLLRQQLVHCLTWHGDFLLRSLRKANLFLELLSGCYVFQGISRGHPMRVCPVLPSRVFFRSRNCQSQCGDCQ